MTRAFHGSIKDIFQVKNRAFKVYQDIRADKRLFEFFKFLQNQLTAVIEYPRPNYYSLIISSKLNDSLNSHKTYCSILKSFLENKNSEFHQFFMKTFSLLTLL